MASRSGDAMRPRASQAPRARLAAGGDPLFDQLLRQGVAANLDRAVVELGEFPVG